MGKKSKKKKKKKIWNTHAQHTMRRRGLENENIYRGGVDNSVYHNHVNSRPSADFIPPTPQPINRLGEGIDVDKLAELRMREEASRWDGHRPVLNDEQEANLKSASDEALFRSKRAKDKSAVTPWMPNREIGGQRHMSHRTISENADEDYDYGHAMFSPMRQDRHFERAGQARDAVAFEEERRGNLKIRLKKKTT